MKKFWMIAVLTIAVFSSENCSNKDSESLQLTVVKVITNYPLKDYPGWYTPPPALEFIIEVKNNSDIPLAIPVNDRGDFYNNSHLFFHLEVECENHKNEIFLYNHFGSSDFIVIEAHETEGFSLLTRFQQLDSLFKECGNGSMNKFLSDVILSGRIIYIGEKSREVGIEGRQYKVVTDLHVAKSEKLEIVEPSNLE